VPTDISIDDPPSDVRDEAIPIVLRALHARQAEQLPVTAWLGPDSEASPDYLIQNSDLREYYGTLIGQIAASHWWNVSELDRLPQTYTAGPGVPASWTVDPWKIACLLRVADAAHIDHRRAPRWLRTLLRPRGESGNHWTFQAKLGKPHLDGDALVYTSSEFSVKDADAWWLCYDTIRMIDRELREVELFFEEFGRSRFAANHIKAIESPARLAKFIRTSGWRPVDTTLRVSDVPALVERFGGKQLYGDDPKVALRELIQNAADAIRARRCVNGTPSNIGAISIALRESENGVWLDVQDNGIGMSASVLTGALLDFGVSLWHSSMMQQEHPGLIGRGLKTTGRFGIGFFSVFMLGKHVKVTSRRYDAAHADMRTLEFQHGLSSRPVLRDSSPDEQWPEYGTKVSVRLFKRPDEEQDHMHRDTL